MSDARKVYRRIKTSLTQLYPKQLNDHQARHLNTLTRMISGIVLNKKCYIVQLNGEVRLFQDCHSSQQCYTIVKHQEATYKTEQAVRGV